MRTLLKIVVAPAALLLVAACASDGAAPVVKNQSAYPALNKELAPRYAALAGAERTEADNADAAYFDGKAADASAGFEVLPDEVSSRNIGADHQGELAEARGRLMAKYTEGYADSQPADLADAQTQYDCWIQEQEEGWQIWHIFQCRSGFEAAMAKMVAKPAAPKPAAKMGPSDYVIYFRFDGSELTNLAASRLQAVIADAGKRKKPTILVDAHTDTRGTDRYNLALSNRRAKTVKDALVAAGIPAGAISAVGRGESQPAVDTGDNVKNGKNRRAEIRITGN